MGINYRTHTRLGISVLASSECVGLAALVGMSWYVPTDWGPVKNGLTVPYKWAPPPRITTRADGDVECISRQSTTLDAVSWPLLLLDDPDTKHVRAILVGGKKASAVGTMLNMGQPNQHSSQGFGEDGSRLAVLVDPAFLWQHCRADNPPELAWHVWLSAPQFWPYWAELEARRLGGGR